MATEVPVGPGVYAKIRHPLAPLGLSIITLGIYGLWWYYTINRETRDAGEEVNPVVSLLAITLGAFIIVPPFVSVYNTGKRVRSVQGRRGAAQSMSPVLGLIMLVIPLVSIFWTTYLQSEANKAWEAGTVGTISPPTPVAPPRPPVAETLPPPPPVTDPVPPPPTDPSSEPFPPADPIA